MEKRVRSPNYPALSLKDAIEKTDAVYRNQHTHAAPREVVVKSMGYAGINGASATAISALNKYGLLERVGDEVKVSERAMRILHPLSPDDRAQAIKDAAQEPALFRELAEKFPGRLPNEEVLRNYLIRNGFSPSAVSGVILAYRETSELVEREGGAYDSALPPASAEAVQPMQTALRPVPVPPIAPMPLPENERPLGRYDFEDGAYVRAVIGGDIDTEAALEMLETIIKLKRAEIAGRNRTRGKAISQAQEVDS